MEKEDLSLDDYYYCGNCKAYSPKNKYCSVRSKNVEKTDGGCSIWEGTEKRIKVQAKFLKINNYIENVEQFYEDHPFFYDKSKIFWMWDSNLKCYREVDEVDIMNMIDDSLGFCGQTVKQHTKSNYLEAFKRVGRKKAPEEAPERWIQFKDKAFSLRSKKEYGVQPNYFFTNPIPWELGENADTPTMDKLFKDWVGEKYVRTLYEIIAYCCYRDYPIQVLFCLYGIGRNGKSCFLKVLNKFIGKENICTTDLDILFGRNRSRFEAFKLYKKLVCEMGETNFDTMENSALLKKLTGGDMIGFEKKGKDPFEEYSYAKITIASNSLPSSEDTSEGFYRRWVIIDFPNQFPEGKDIIATIPEQEYKNLARKVTEIIPKLIDDGVFTNQGSIDERKEKYISASNPLPIFINKFCEEGTDNYVRYGELFAAYCLYLKQMKRRIVSRKEFSKFLDSEGYEKRKTWKDNENAHFVEGIKLIQFWKEEIINVTYVTDVTKSVTSSNLYETKLQKRDIGHKGHKENIHLKCSICGATPCKSYDPTGKPICLECAYTYKKNNVVVQEDIS